MSGMETNMFVHVYILPHHQSFPHSPSTYHILPLWLHRMPPKSKPNTHSGTAQTLPGSHKCQGSNADQLKTKTTWCKTIEANDDDNNENKSGNKQEAADGVEDNDDKDKDNPQHWEVVDEGVPWKKAPLEGTSGMIIVNSALIPLFFFFCFHDYLLFFTGKLPMFRLMVMWNCPHKGTPGTIIMIVPFFLSFFWILTLFTGRLPTFELTMMWNHPHQGMLGMIIMIMPFFFILFFFLWVLTVFLQGNCPHSGLQWCGTVPTKVHWAQLLRYMPFFLFSYSYCFFYRRTTRNQAHNDREMSPPAKLTP